MHSGGYLWKIDAGISIFLPFYKNLPAFSYPEPGL